MHTSDLEIRREGSESGNESLPLKEQETADKAALVSRSPTKAARHRERVDITVSTTDNRKLFEPWLPSGREIRLQEIPLLPSIHACPSLSRPSNAVSTRLNYNAGDIYCHAYRLFPSEDRRWTGRKPGIAIQLVSGFSREKERGEEKFPDPGLGVCPLPSARINGRVAR